MPVYEYYCRNCHAEFEILILRSEDRETVTCPRCEHDAVTRMLSCVNVARSQAHRATDRSASLATVNPSDPQAIAQHLKDHGSRFGDAGFRGSDSWHNAVDRVAQGGPTREE